MPDHSPLEPVRTVVREPGAAPVLAAPIQGDDLPDIPGYEVHREIARGAMGRVLAARDLSLDREVAIKIILAGEEASDARLRFVRESKITARLPHPGVPPVYAIGSLLDGRPYLAMKLVGGTTLADQLKGRPSPSHNLPRFVQVFEQIAQTVAFAHAEGVIHRDLKPANVMVGAFGEVQVMDWGIARLVVRGQETGDRGQRIGEYEVDPLENQGGIETWPLVGETSDGVEALERTRDGQILGSPAYMSPEQARGEVDRVDARSDVFSLGAMLCEILTGRIPFKAKSSREVLQLVAACDLTDISSRLDESGGDAELIALTKRCLAPDPADRPADGKAVAEAVAAYRAGVEDRLLKAQADRAATEVRVVEGLRRRKVQKIAVCVVIFVLGVGVAGTTIGLFREAEQRRIAEENERDALKAAEEERQAKLREQAQKTRAETARDRTRDVLDAMTSAVTGDSLSTQKVISVEQRRFLIDVLTYYKEFAGEKADNEFSRKRTAKAAYKVGLIEGRLGNLTESSTAFRQARDGFSTLVVNFPSEPEYRQELARSQSELGVMIAGLGKLKEAEGEHRRALLIQENLASDFPNTPEYRLRLARSYNRLGNLLSGQLNYQEAEGEYRKALIILKALTIEFPDDIEYSEGLAWSHYSLGNMLADLGERVNAEREYRQALTTQQKLAADYPDDPEHRSDQAASHNRLGILFSNHGKRAEAELEYRKALTIREKLASDFPAVPNYRQEEAGSRNNIANLLHEMGKHAEAEAEYRKALAIQETITVDFPKIPRYRQDLALSHHNLGDLLDEFEKRVEAGSEFRKALAIREKLATDFPNVPRYRSDEAASHNRLGILLAHNGKQSNAESEYRKALKLQEKLALDYPAIPAYRSDVARSHHNLGITLVELRKQTEAESEYRNAISIYSKLAGEFPFADLHRQDLAGSHNGLGTLLSDLGRLKEAEVELLKALVLREKLATEFPDLPKFRGHVSKTNFNLACVYSVSSSKVADKKQAYADRAMEMLHKAVKAGYTDAAHMAKDTDLDPLRDRADFKMLLDSLQPKPKGNAPLREPAPPPREKK